MSNQLNEMLQNKIHDFVRKSEKDTQALIEKLTNRVIDDLVIPAHLIRFDPFEGRSIMVKVEDISNQEAHQWSLNSDSAYQVADRIGLPQKWVSEASVSQDLYRREAAATAMSLYMGNYKGKDDRFLFRNVDGVVRGFLSTSYKRINTRDIFLMFLLVAQQNNLPVIGAYEGTSKDFIEVLDPELTYVETPNNGLVAYATGMQLRNSDFGNGRLELRSYRKNPVCLNGLIGTSYLKEVHLGARLSQDFMFSIETVSKDTETRALMVRDAMNHVFSRKVRDHEREQILEASNSFVDLKQEIIQLPKLGIYKPEVQAVEEVLLRRDENDGVSGIPSKYMVSQAISAVARNSTEERMRELETIAGSLVFTRELN